MAEQLQKIAESTIKTQGFKKLKTQDEVIGVGGEQWMSADIRIRASISGSQMTFIAVDTSGSPDSAGTSIINACKNQGKSALAGNINSFFDIWDNQTVSFAEIELGSLLTCLDAELAGDVTADGISVYFYANSGPTIYPRLEGEVLPFIYPDCRKTSFATDKKVFVRGDFNGYPQNAGQKKGLPACAIMGETINILSTKYKDRDPSDVLNSPCYNPDRTYDSEANVDAWFGCSMGAAKAKLTTIAASFLSFKGPNRTLEDYFVMHESWKNVELKHAGSMINYSETAPTYPISLYSHAPRFKKNQANLATYLCTKNPASLIETMTTSTLTGKAKLWD